MSDKVGSRHSVSLLLKVLVVVGLSSCSLHTQTPLPVIPTDKASSILGEATAFEDPGRWWSYFKDSSLSQWMDKTLAHNPDLLSARARVEQRLASKDQSWAKLFPNLSLSSSKSRRINQSEGDQTAIDGFSLALESSYDLDLFGMNSSTLKASELDLLAAVEDYKHLLANTASQTAKAWFGHQETMEQIRLAKENVDADKANHEWILQSYRQGQAQVAEVYAAKEQWLGSKIQLTNLKVVADQQARRLRILAGDYPSGFDQDRFVNKDSELPEIVPGLMSGVLKRRPDVKRAMLNLKAQDHRIAAAVAARFPRLSFTAQIGQSNSETEGLGSSTNLFGNLVANLSLPLIDMGQRRAEVRRQEKLLEELLAVYRKTVLQAYFEVEDALIRNQSGQKKIELMQEQVELSKKRLVSTKDGFLRGINQWDQVLTAQQQVYNYQRSLLQEQLAWTEARIDLYTYLGGHWTGDYVRENTPGPIDLPEVTP